MAQKKESDTLRQRRLAQQEFLNLKKMQSGEINAGPKPSEVAKPLTFGEKIKNVWYHDKFALSVIAIILVAVALLCVQCATKTVYDATVVVFTHKITGDPNCSKMAEYLTPYCPDLNGDGEVNVNVINCSINPNDKSDYSFTNRSKAQSLLATDASALLFITDDDSYDYLMSLSKDIPLFEGEPLEFKEDFYKFCVDPSGFYDTPEDLQISCRAIEGAAISKDKDIDKHYTQAQAILNGLKNVQ